MQTIDEKIGSYFSQLDVFHTQLNDLDTKLSDLNFERFLVEQAWAAEDEAKFQ